MGDPGSIEQIQFQIGPERPRYYYHRGTAAGRSTVHVFEGMTDFLSFLVLNGVKASPDECIIMHSLSSFHRAVAQIRSQNYQTIKTYLDNDKAGQQGTDRFKAEFGAMPSLHTTI